MVMLNDAPPVLENCAICVLTYNRCEQLASTLSHIKREFSSDLIPVVVVNNGSTDGTKALLSHWAKDWPELILINSETNTGCAKGREIGWRQVNSAFILSLDDDIFIARKGLIDLIGIARKESRAGLISPLMVDSETGSILNPIHSGRNTRSFYEACFLIKRETIRAVGYFDSVLTVAGEGLDYSIRMMAAGLTIVRAPGVVVRHFDRVRDVVQMTERRKLWLWSFCYVYWKNYRLSVAVLFSMRSLLAHLRRGMRENDRHYVKSLLCMAASGARAGRAARILGRA